MPPVLLMPRLMVVFFYVNPAVLRSYFAVFTLASPNKVLSTTHHTPFPLRHCSPDRRRRLLSCRIRRPPSHPQVALEQGAAADESMAGGIGAIDREDRDGDGGKGTSPAAAAEDDGILSLAPPSRPPAYADR